MRALQVYSFDKAQDSKRIQEGTHRPGKRLFLFWASVTHLYCTLQTLSTWAIGTMEFKESVSVHDPGLRPLREAALLALDSRRQTVRC